MKTKNKKLVTTHLVFIGVVRTCSNCGTPIDTEGNCANSRQCGVCL